MASSTTNAAAAFWLHGLMPRGSLCKHMQEGPLESVASQRCSPSNALLGTGLLAARTASGITGRSPADETGIKLESMVRAGLTYPVGEALAMYYQVPSQGPELSKYRPK